MEPSPLLTFAIAVVAVGLVALCVIVIQLLLRFRSLVTDLEKTRMEVSEQLQSGRIDALQQAQEQMDRMSERLQGLQNALNERLDSQRQVLSQQLGESGKTVADLKKELGALSEATGRIFDLGKDIASLEDLLSSPKLRGGLGEILLERLLAQAFRSSQQFETQYAFSDGTVVDAVIRIGDRLVPIDSKFPIEDFRRVLEAEEKEQGKARRQFLANVKKKVDDIAVKYIKPDEGTFEFAFMYIPAENVYYETIVRDEKAEEGDGMAGILGYAVDKKVIPVSPNSLFPYLQVVLYGLKGMELEQRGNEILAYIRRLQGDLEKFAKEYRTLGTHLTHARGSYDKGDKRLGGLGEKLISLEVGPDHERLSPSSAEEET